MKKTPVGKIDNFSFIIDEITIPVKVLVMDAPQYQALVKNNWLQKANANLNWETQDVLNKLYHYPHDAEMIFDLTMALINRATQENVCQIKESEYIVYTFEITGYNYEDEVEVYYQIASHTYPTKEAQAQWLEQINIKLCKECIMPCDEQWCPECYALSIPLPSENNENKIEFGEPKATKKIEATLIYLIKNQPALQLKYFNNNR
ncbi:hypothetical protein G9A89_003023 [Geosiphon pyriformis]|nr:hypothetical protein G9A89_003023 [Geosiphon pyriformis]